MPTRDEVDEGMRAVCGDCGRPKATGLEGIGPGTEEAKALCWSYLPTGTLCERLAIARLRSQLATVERERDIARECMLANEAELYRASERIGKLREALRRISGDADFGCGHPLQTDDALAADDALATPPPSREDGEPGAGGTEL